MDRKGAGRSALIGDAGAAPGSARRRAAPPLVCFRTPCYLCGPVGGRPMSAEDGVGSRVLMVDDDPDFLDMFAELLAASGHEVMIAKTAAEAQSQVADFAPDLVLIDLSLGGASGLELGPELRALCPLSPRLVAITGWSDQATVAAAERLGFDGFLTKPIGLIDLGPFLEQRTKQRRSSAEGV